MEVWAAFWGTLGIILGFAVGTTKDGKVDGNDKGQSGDNNVGDSDIPDRSRSRSCDHGTDKRLEAEEVIAGLQNLRLALGRREKEYLDYACYCTELIEKIREGGIS